ncbi:MAG: tetratricopeptide repeat protein, partial [Terriglobales bacterium]
AYNEALRLDPGFRPAALAKAVLLEDLGRFDEALAAYDALLRQHPGDVAACSNRAGLLLQLGQPQAALASLDAALAADPANDLLALNKGLLLLQGLGDAAAARPWLERARDAGFAEAAAALSADPPPRD